MNSLRRKPSGQRLLLGVMGPKAFTGRKCKLYSSALAKAQKAREAKLALSRESTRWGEEMDFFRDVGCYVVDIEGPNPQHH